MAIGYQGKGSFWGTDIATGQPKSNWWNQDTSDAGQALFSDPNSALQAATLPDELLAQQAEMQEYARVARGGFMAQLGQGLKNIDSALSNIPGWGVTKDVASTMWWPVDKLATGAYWLYSEAISQPLSTALLTAADAELTGDYGKLNPFADESTWGKNYDEAEHISPAQAFMNYENTAEASGQGTLLSGLTAGGADNLNAKQRENVKRNTDRFMYDTDYWRDQQGWTYTAGTGAIDFMLVMGADPTYAAVKGITAAVKGARSIKLTTAAPEATRSISGVNMLAEKAGQAIGSRFAKTPEEASRSSKVNNFFDWADGKSAAEIAQHPIWGRGRRINPERNRLSEAIATTPRADMPLLLRFAGGDNGAAMRLAQNSVDNGVRLANMMDNRVLVDSVKFDNDLLQAFTAEKTPSVAANMPVHEVEAYQGAARSIISKTRGLGPKAAAKTDDLLMAQKWKAGKLESMNQQIGALQKEGTYYADVLGNIGKGVDDFSPAESNLFGTVSSLYRQGPLALRSAEKAADKNITRLTGAQTAKVTKDQSGFVSRTIRNGFYSPVVRVINSFGERVPQTMIDHNADDAFERVSEMLRSVPKLDPEARLGMINAYTNAGDKVARAQELDKIHAGVIEHMASGFQLNRQAAREISNMIKTGQVHTMQKLTGQVPNDQMFTAAKTGTGDSAVRADLIEDGDAWVVAPLSKSQLSVSQPLLDVKELRRYLQRNSTFINQQIAAGGSVKDAIASTADSLNNIWKAATLLRPGYVLRSMSDEQAASAVKFGVMTMAMDTGKGGANWALNRAQQLKAYTVGGSYVPTTGKAAGSKNAVIQISDENMRDIAAKYPELKADRINPGKAWPLIEGRLTHERDQIAELEKALEKESKLKKPDQMLVQMYRDAIDDHSMVADEFAQYAGAILDETARATGRRLGEGYYEYKGHRIPQAFNKDWANPIPRDQITSARAMETIFARSEAVEMNRLMKTGSWKTIDPKDPTHMDSWLRGLNMQYRQDEVFRLVAQDPTLKSAQAWLRTPAGKSHLHDLGIRARDPQAHVANVKSVLDHYLPPGTGLQDKLGKGEEITSADLRAAMHESDFPVVHGEEFTSLTKHGRVQSASAAIDKLIERGFNRLSTVPNDVMARQPIYLRAQEARMKQLIDQELAYKAANMKDEVLTGDDLNNLLKKSDRLARKDIAQVVYDPTRTTATEALRFAAPFMAAHVDGLSRWAGLIAEKPQFTATAAKIYNAPVAAGLVTDSSGNAVGQDGYADVIDPTTGKVVDRKFVPLEDRVINFRIPDGTTGRGKEGSFPIKVSAINTLLPGDPWFNPGSGPFVQMGANEIARHSPAMGDFLQWAKVIPYGPSGDRMDPLIPKYLRDAWGAYTAEEAGNEQYQQIWLEAYKRQMAEYHNGGPAPDMKSITKEAKQFMFLDALSSWAMPAQNAATPLTGSPYQFFLDQYKAMQEIDPENAKTKFFQKYGSDYFMFTADLSKSMGVQSTLSAQHTAEMYGDLIAQDPDLAGLIVGDVYNSGKFSTSVYRQQMNEYMGGERMRQKISALDSIQENQKDLGWQQYNKYMSQVDAQLIRSGFHSYNQAGAEALSDLKSTITNTIAGYYPAWAQDFGESANPMKTRLRIQGMERIVQDEKLMSDPMRYDLQGLGMYLAQRKNLKDQLAARGAKSISFGTNGQPIGENADIGMGLKTLQLYLVNSNLGFADIYHRYLENDDLS